MPKYDFVIDSSFRPYSFKEMLEPIALYHDAYKEAEREYDELVQKADTFSYLADKLKDSPDSKAAKIYKGYADELHKQAEDLAKNGLSVNNRRSLVNLKRRYLGEIGKLERAESRRLMEQQRRDALRAKGINMLYANENPTIDQYLEEEGPNVYGINPDDLRNEAAQYAQSVSSKVYGNPSISNVNKYYQEIAQTQGYSPELMAAWRQNLETIPEFNQAVEDIMEGRGANANLSGINREIARQNVINGIMEGAMYKENRKVEQNPGVLTAAQSVADARQRDQMALNAALYGYKKINGEWVPDENLQNVKGRSASNSSSSSSSSSGKKSSGSNKITQSASGQRIRWKGNTPNDYNEDADRDYEVEDIASDDVKHEGILYSYDKLPKYAQEIANQIIGDADDTDLYQYYFRPYSKGFNDTEAVLEVIPRSIKDFHPAEQIVMPFEIH